MLGLPVLAGSADLAEDAAKRRHRRKHKINALLHEGAPVRHWDRDLGPDIPQLVATDLDGTLVHSDGTITPRTREALLALQAQGVIVVFVTGRPLRWAREVFDDVGEHGMAIVSNGALVWDVHQDQPDLIRAVAPEVGFGASAGNTISPCAEVVSVRLALGPPVRLTEAPTSGVLSASMTETSSNALFEDAADGGATRVCIVASGLLLPTWVTVTVPRL